MDHLKPKYRIAKLKQFRDLEPMIVAVLRFSGSNADSVVSARTAELITALEKTKWPISGGATAFF
jgi:hypothetical protein